MGHSTTVFKNGGSKAVRLPADSCEVGDEMLVRKVGYAIMLIPKDKAWKMFHDACESGDPAAPIERLKQPKLRRRKRPT